VGPRRRQGKYFSRGINTACEKTTRPPSFSEREDQSDRRFKSFERIPRKSITLGVVSWGARQRCSWWPTFTRDSAEVLATRGSMEELRLGKETQRWMAFLSNVVYKAIHLSY
jgi:hypothetical protein